MAEQFDVVVIGSGLGGLAAATNLSRRGVKTLVVENRDRVWNASRNDRSQSVQCR